MYVLGLGMEARTSCLLGTHSTPSLLTTVCKAHQNEAEGVGSILHIPGFPMGNREALASPVIHHKAGSFILHPVWVLVS